MPENYLLSWKAQQGGTRSLPVKEVDLLRAQGFFLLKLLILNNFSSASILCLCIIGINRTRSALVLIHQVCVWKRKTHHGNDPGHLPCVINEARLLHQSESKSCIRCSCGIKSMWNRFLHLHTTRVKSVLLCDSWPSYIYIAYIHVGWCIWL